MLKETVTIQVCLAGTPLLEKQLFDGLLLFGQRHPHWRFSMQSRDIRHSKEWLMQRNVKGALVVINPDTVAPGLDAANIPWVQIMPPGDVSVPSVTNDDAMIGRMGAEYFLEKGFLRCAFCGVGTPWSNKRAAGFMERIREAGRDCAFIDIPRSLENNWTVNRRAQTKLLKWVEWLGPGTAVMAGHDIMSNRLVDICTQHGIRIPRDLAVLGVGNHPMLCTLASVPVSSIDDAGPDLGLRAARLLEGLIEGTATDTHLTVPPVGVVERLSTEMPVYGDTLVADIVSYIRAHACGGVTVDDILKAFPVSRRTLSRRFAKYVGRSPSSEIRRVRVQEARRMLAETDVPLSDIAMACSYADLPHMDRAFRKTFGASPGELRRGAFHQ